MANVTFGPNITWLPILIHSFYVYPHNPADDYAISVYYSCWLGICSCTAVRRCAVDGADFSVSGAFFSIAGSATYSLSAGSFPKLRQHNYVISYCDERGGLTTYIFVNCNRSDRSAHLLHGAYEYTAEAGNRTGLLRSAYYWPDACLRYKKAAPYRISAVFGTAFPDSAGQKFSTCI